MHAPCDWSPWFNYITDNNYIMHHHYLPQVQSLPRLITNNYEGIVVYITYIYTKEVYSCTI